MKHLVLVLVLVLVLDGCASNHDVTPRLDDEAVAADTTSSLPALPAPRFDGPLSVDDCVRLALGSTLTARGFEARLDAAHGSAQNAGIWPNPTIEYTAEDIGLVGDGRRQLQQQELVSYPVFAFWTKGLEADVARADEARTVAQVADDRRVLVGEVGRAFYELLASEAAVKNEAEAAEIAEKLAAAASKRRALGDASALDEQRARAESLEAQRDLAVARRQRVIDGLSFALALGAERPVALRLAPGWPETLPPELAAADTASLVERALATRPDVQEAEASVLHATRSLDLEDRKGFPLADWTIGAGGRQGPGGYGAVFAAGGPLPVLDRNQGPRARARADLESALVALERTRRALAFEVEGALFGWERTRSTLEELARPIAKAREANLDAMRRLFAAGEVSYIDLVQARRDAVAARRQLIDAEKDAALARWRLVVAVGGPAAASPR